MQKTWRERWGVVASAGMVSLAFGSPVAVAVWGLVSPSPTFELMERGARPPTEVVWQLEPTTEEVEAQEEVEAELIVEEEPAPGVEELALPTEVIVSTTPAVVSSRALGPGEGTRAIAARPKSGRSGVARKVRRRHSRCLKDHPQVHEGRGGVVEVEQALVDHYTRSIKSFMELGWSEPYNEDGLKGWYISGFGCASPVYKAGMRRGDVLLSVNGKKTRSWLGVFMLYKKLKHKQDFELKLVRKGEPLTLHFRIVES